MTDMTTEQRSEYRRALIKAGISTRGMTDAELAAAAAEQPAPATPAPAAGGLLGATPAPAPATPAPAPQAPAAAGDLGAQIAALIAGAMQQTPAIDERQIIALIKEHATTALEVTTPERREPIRIEGAHQKLAEVVAWLNTGTNVLLVGPAGSGKTTLAEQAAKALDRPFYSSGAIMASYELLGIRNAHGEYIATPLRQAFEHGGVFLLDEIDGCSPRALICFNQLLANDLFCFPDGMVKKHPDFVVVGGSNTNGLGATRQYTGRAQLDAATLDRFFEIQVDYDQRLEERLAIAEYKAHGGQDEALIAAWLTKVWKLREQVKKHKMTALITPRASIMGARGLAVGQPLATIEAGVLHKHLTADQRKQLGVAA